MDIDSIIQYVILYAQDNMIVSAVIGLFILYLLFRHPKMLLLVVIFLVTAYWLAWLFRLLATKGLG